MLVVIYPMNSNLSYLRYSFFSLSILNFSGSDFFVFGYMCLLIISKYFQRTKAMQNHIKNRKSLWTNIGQKQNFQTDETFAQAFVITKCCLILIYVYKTNSVILYLPLPSGPIANSLDSFVMFLPPLQCIQPVSKITTE